MHSVVELNILFGDYNAEKPAWGDLQLFPVKFTVSVH